MKISDLMDKQHTIMAIEAGKRLAKIVGNINLSPRKPSSKLSFSSFMNPKPLHEIENSAELKQLQDAISAILKAPVHCSRHFVERAFERERDVPVLDIINLFKRCKAKYASTIANSVTKAKMGKQTQFLVQDYTQNLNLSFFPTGDSFELMSMMRINCDKYMPVRKPGIDSIVLKVGVKKQLQRRYG